MLAFLSGWRLYVLGAALLAFVGLSGYAAYEHQAVAGANKDTQLERAKTLAVQKERDDLANKLAQEEVDKAGIIKERDSLDAIVVSQAARERKLQDEKAQVWEQFDKLIAAAPKADQDCAARPLPPAVSEFLRDDGPTGSHQDSPPKSPGSPDAALQ
ncbi:MAG TPA: hypothetical protein VIV09_17050 [Pseudolabrys sp.]